MTETLTGNDVGGDAPDQVVNNNWRGLYQGDGLPDCQHCLGRGVVNMPYDKDHPIARTKQCACVMMREVKRNVERGCPGLLKDMVIKGSDLMGRETDNLWVVSENPSHWRAHLRYMAIRMGPRWGFSVRSDRDLISAWLSTAKTVHDADVQGDRVDLSKVIDRYVDLEGMVMPPDLLILEVGEKVARNDAAPEVVFEAIKMRLYLKKPTWLVDGSNTFHEEPVRVWEPGQVRTPQSSWCSGTQMLIDRWDHIKVDLTPKALKEPKRAPPKVRTNPSVVPVRQADPVDLDGLTRVGGVWGGRTKDTHASDPLRREEMHGARTQATGEGRR